MIVAELRRLAEVRMAEDGEMMGVTGVASECAAWTEWDEDGCATVVLTDEADLHTAAHELAHLLLGHGEKTDARLTLQQRGQLEVDAETGAVSLLRQAGACDGGTVERSTMYILGWLGLTPGARPSDEARRLRIGERWE